DHPTQPSFPTRRSSDLGLGSAADTTVGATTGGLHKTTDGVSDTAQKTADNTKQKSKETVAKSKDKTKKTVANTEEKADQTANQRSEEHTSELQSRGHLV